jgi:acyl-CoA synthetase (AMP-forming)/AMP-acid ligase II
MPVMFWNDPEERKYRSAYFERFPGVWCHGDFAEWTAHGGIVIHGRSDATLNPGGVRIGTAEIYAQVEQIPEVLEAVAVGQDWDNDVRVSAVRAARRWGAPQGRLARDDPQENPFWRRAVPCAGQDRADRRYSAHQLRQDHRTRGAQRDPWPEGEEHRGACQSRGARTFIATCRNCGRTRFEYGVWLLSRRPIRTATRAEQVTQTMAILVGLRSR